MNDSGEWSCPCCGKLQPLPEAARIVDEARLTGQRARMFLAMANASGRAVSIDTLADCCWPHEADVPDQYQHHVRVQVSYLRKRIVDLGFTIELVHAAGYRLLRGGR